MRTPHIWVVLLLLFGTATLLHLRGDVDHVPPSEPLAQLPESIGPWTSQDIPIGANVLEVLGKGIFLNRVYVTPAAPDKSVTGTAPIGLFIGYFPTQRTGQAIHSPQNCLPGSGWVFESSGVTNVIEASGKKYQVGEYVISDGVSRQEVLYWYRTHGRSIANDYSAKVHMLMDSILYNRTDAALIRVTTPISANETQAVAHSRVMRFTERVSPMLPAYIPD